MKSLPLVALTVALAAGSAAAQRPQITAAQAESLVRTVLRHEKLKFPSPYCELERLDKDGKAFAPDFYSFGANCDYPNARATTVLGLYVVSPRTGEVWEYNQCKLVTFRELVNLRRKMLGGAYSPNLAEDKSPCQ